MTAEVAQARTTLGDAAFAAAWNAGRAMTLDEAVEYALSEGEKSSPALEVPAYTPWKSLRD